MLPVCLLGLYTEKNEEKRKFRMKLMAIVGIRVALRRFFWNEKYGTRMGPARNRMDKVLPSVI